MGNCSSQWEGLLATTSQASASSQTINASGGSPRKGSVVPSGRRPTTTYQHLQSIEALEEIAAASKEGKEEGGDGVTTRKSKQGKKVKEEPSFFIQLKDPVARFDNLRGEDIEALWRTFVAQQESFAATKPELINVLSVLKEAVGGSDPQKAYAECTEVAGELFDYWIAHNNHEVTQSKYVDVMEIIMAFLFVSKMPVEDKASFLFDCMDFDGDEDLDFGELAISLKSIEGGLAKLRGDQPSTYQKITELVREWFPILAKAEEEGNKTVKLSREAFMSFMLKEEGIPMKVLSLFAEAEGEACIEADSDLLLAPRPEKMQGGGDEFMAIKPWLGAVFPPAYPFVIDSSAPSNHLTLEWIHGLTVESSYNNVRYLPSSPSSNENQEADDIIVYNAAAVGIVLYRDGRKGGQLHQRFFLEHTDDVVSIAVGQQKEGGLRMVATGELGKSPKIEVWNPIDTTPIYSFQGLHTRGIGSLAFSPDGHYLASIGLDDEHTLAIYTTTGGVEEGGGKLHASTKATKQRVLAMEWNPFLDNVKGGGAMNKLSTSSSSSSAPAGKLTNGKQISTSQATSSSGSPIIPHLVTCGIKCVDFWEHDRNGGNLKGSKALFKTAKMTTFTSIAYLPEDGNVMIGTAVGGFYVFKGREFETEIPSDYAHRGPVLALYNHLPSSFQASPTTYGYSRMILSAGKDGKVIIWRGLLACNQLKKENRQVVDVFANGLGLGSIPSEKGIRSVQLSSNGTKILIGTQGAEIYEIQLPSAAIGNSTTKPIIPRKGPLISGHCKGEVWGLAVDPNRIKSRYMTVGDDALLKLWDTGARYEKTQVKDGQGRRSTYVRNEREGKAPTLLQAFTLPGPARCCAWSPDSTMIAIGFGTGSSPAYLLTSDASASKEKGKKSKEDGTIRVYELQDPDPKQGEDAPYTLVLKHEAKDAKEWISEIRYTPDGKTLVAGSHDNCVYLYSVFQKFKRKAKFSKHNSYITHFDLSRDSNYMRSNCGAYELLFSNLQTGQQVPAPEAKDVDWATTTCVLGWSLQGIWPPSADGTDINAVDRSTYGSVLATGDDWGKIKLFRYPCVKKQSSFNVSIGHASHVTCVRFTPGDEFLMSTGGNDKCVFQWRHHHHQGLLNQGNNKPTGLSKSTAAVIDELIPNEKREAPGADVNANDPDSLIHMPSGGDEFMATKPWLGAIIPPTTPPRLDQLKWELNTQLRNVLQRQSQLRQQCVNPEWLTKLQMDGAKVNALLTKTLRGEKSTSNTIGGGGGLAPYDDGLRLEWVHGYRSEDCRNNVVYANQGKIVYHAAALGIVLSVQEEDNNHPARKSQKYCSAHTDDVVSLACHPKGVLVATGQLGKLTKIHVWNIETREVISTLQGHHTKGVVLLSFNQEGNLLATVGQDDDNSIAIYEWATRTLRGTAKGGKDKVLAITFVPSSTSTSTDFITCGVKHIKYWTRQGLNLAAKDITIGDASLKTLAFSTIGWLGRDAIIGTSAGSLVVLNTEKKNVSMSVVQERIPQEKIPSMQVNPEPTAHEKGGAVYACCQWKDEEGKEYVLTGGKDGRIIYWSKDITGAIVKTRVVRISSTTTTTSSSNTSQNPTTEATAAPVVVMEELGVSKHEVLDLSTSTSPTYLPMDKSVRSIALSKDGLRLLIGTASSEILELNLPPSNHGTENKLPIIRNGGPLVVGHYKDEVWGLATHPTKREYATVGDDGTLRLWDIETRTMKASVKVGGMARAVGYSPLAEGRFLAVGMGGSVGRGRQRTDGVLKVYDTTPSNNAREEGGSTSNLSLIFTAHDAKEWISDVKFSPDGKSLAVASHDNNIYIYAINVSSSTVSIKLRSKFAKHKSYVTHLDFSADSHYMQSNCGGYELLFANIQTGQHMTKPSELRDVQWATWTCVLGWPVQGIWPACSNGTDVNAVDRSHVGSLIAAGDDFGKVKLFSYPCVQEKSQALEYLGHSSHVTNVRWSAYDECLLSTGGADKCIFQWANNVAADGGYGLATSSPTGSCSSNSIDASIPVGSGQQAARVSRSPSKHGSGQQAARLARSPSNQGTGPVYAWGAEDDPIPSYHEPELQLKVSAPPSSSSSNSSSSAIGNGGEGGEKGPSGGDEFMSVKPWLGAIRAPDGAAGSSAGSISNGDPRPPSIDLQLEWAYGYSGHTYRGNLFYTSGGQRVVYPAAALGVVLTIDRRDDASSSSSRTGSTKAINQSSSSPTNAVKFQEDSTSNPNRSIDSSLQSAPRHMQSFYLGHQDDIIALDVCPKRRFVATGQIGRMAEIRIWDSTDGSRQQHVCTLPPLHQRGIASLAFHPEGERLASIGLDDDHSIAVWKDTGGSWSKIVREANAKGDRNAVFFLLWAQGGPANSKDGKKNDEEWYPLVSGGVRHIRFWRVEGGAFECRGGGRHIRFWRVEGGALNAGGKGVFGKVTQPQALLCASNFYVEGQEWRLVTGASSGEFLLWKGRECVLSRKAHDRAVESVVASPILKGNLSPEQIVQSSRLVTGGREGMVKVWNASLEILAEYDLTTYRNYCLEPSIKALDIQIGDTSNAKGLGITRILVGTGGAEVLEIQTDNRTLEDASVIPLTQGHYADELWGIGISSSSFSPTIGAGSNNGTYGQQGKGIGGVQALSQQQQLFVTSGDDGTVRIWDAEAHAMVGRFLLPRRRVAAKATAAKGAYSPSKKGTTKGAAATVIAAEEDQPSLDSSSVKEGGNDDAITASSTLGPRYMSRAVAWEASRGDYLLVGLGGDMGTNLAARGGGHMVLRAEAASNRSDPSSSPSRSAGNKESRDTSSSFTASNNRMIINPLFSSRLEKEWVSDVKWCPPAEGEEPAVLTYATASHDRFIRVFAIPADPSSYFVDTDGINQPPPPTYLLRLQIINESLVGPQYAQSTCGGYDLLFWDVSEPKALTSFREEVEELIPQGGGGRQLQKRGGGARSAAAAGAGEKWAYRKDPLDPVVAEKSVDVRRPVRASAARNAKWSTWTLPLGWPVQGIWSGTMDGSDVNAVCRNSLGATPQMLAVGGDDCKVKLYNYPSISTNAQCVEGKGHASHVTTVRYLEGKQGVRLLTAGGGDKTILQWRVVPV